MNSYGCSNEDRVVVHMNNEEALQGYLGYIDLGSSVGYYQPDCWNNQFED